MMSSETGRIVEARSGAGRRARACLAALVAAAAVGCGGAGHLAVVGDRRITIEQLQAFVAAQTGRAASEVSPALTGALFARLLEEEVLLAASPAPGDRELAPAARSARVRALMASLCPPPPAPSEAQIEAYIAAHPEVKGGGERLELRQLVLPDEATARLARDRVRAGEDFLALSRELSRAPNAGDGGLLGWVDRNQLPPEFEAAIAGLAPGDVSEPVASNAGWHVFQVMARRGAGDAPDAGVRDRVRARLAAEAAEATQRSCLAQLAAKVGVRVDCRGATFPCRNPFERTS